MSDDAAYPPLAPFEKLAVVFRAKQAAPFIANPLGRLGPEPLVARTATTGF